MNDAARLKGLKSAFNTRISRKILSIKKERRKMGTKGLIPIAEEYFYSINPLAQRIGEDVSATKQAYEGLWNTLSLSEQNQAIDETIITPEIALKYASRNLESVKELPKSYPKLCIQTGMKYIIDETGSTLRWRDEHSAPFSFMTQSQMNLNLSDSSEETKSYPYKSYILGSPHFSNPMQNSQDTEISLIDDYSSSSKQLSFYKSDNYSDTIFSTSCRSNLLNSLTDSDNSESIFSKLINKTSLLKIQNDYDDDLERLVPLRNAQKPSISDKSQMNISLSTIRQQSSDTTESTALLDTPSSYSSYQSSHLNQDDSIPKTGFEFLDNW